ncbi:MAG: DMT family transporter [Tetrasphaera sp.]
MIALLALASSAVWGTSDFAAGLIAKRRPAAAVVGWSQAVSLVVMSVLVAWPGRAWPGGGWPVWAVVAGFSGGSALVCFYGALSTGTMGVVAPIASLGVVVPVLLGVLGGEQPGLVTWAGMIVAVLGVLLASGPELDGSVGLRPVVLACCAGAGFGVTLYSLDRGARSSVLHTLWGMRATSVTCFVLAALLLRRLGGMQRSDLPALAFVGVADLCANALFAVASSRGYVSVASVLGSLYPVVTAGWAYAVLHERLRGVQNAGIALTMAGVALIAGGSA